MEPFPRDEVIALVRRVPAYGLLAWRLGRDPSLAPSRRGALIGAAAYLVSPIDVVPGIIPLAGQLDDLLVLVVALRFALAGMPPQQRAVHLTAAGLSEATLAADEQALRDIGLWAARAAAMAMREVSRLSLRAGARVSRGLVDAGRSSVGAGRSSLGTIGRVVPRSRATDTTEEGEGGLLTAMATLTIDEYRATLRGLVDWEPYLVAHSNLPGPRGNLELLEAVGDVAPAERLFTFAASDDEFLAASGAAGLGRLVADDPLGGTTSEEALARMHVLADDPRWRVREGVAMALQRIGDAEARRLLDILAAWSTGSPLCRRAVVAGICEPRLLADPTVAGAAVEPVDRITASLLAESERRDPEVRVLRQALGYGWSVAIVGAPAISKAAFERLTASGDSDARWIVRENLGKARLSRLDPAWLAAMRERA